MVDHPEMFAALQEGERRGMASQPTKVSFRTNKNRWITETVAGASYRTDLAEKSYVWKCQFSLERLMLSKFTNVEQLLCLCMHIPQQDNTRVAEFQLKYILLLKNILELLPGLNTVLKDAHSNCLCSAREALSDSRFAKILERILQTLNNDARHEKNFTASHMQRNFAVKTNINGLLDVARKTYCEIIEDIVGKLNKCF
ncbi:unnamed protein product [Timema podura]|uniref:Uncharacterized protein n=1 Tax=Timema podura TaxID=61482 RepID=A0ABN7P465_TIMPD|nr:unnamed protein product [Timema podura]